MRADGQRWLTLFLKCGLGGVGGVVGRSLKLSGATAVAAEP